jgi:hypothetical protein
MSFTVLRFLADIVVKLVKESGEELAGAFEVIQPSYIRINPGGS